MRCRRWASPPRSSTARSPRPKQRPGWTRWPRAVRPRLHRPRTAPQLAVPGKAAGGEAAAAGGRRGPLHQRMGARLPPRLRPARPRSGSGWATRRRSPSPPPPRRRSAATSPSSCSSASRRRSSPALPGRTCASRSSNAYSDLDKDADAARLPRRDARRGHHLCRHAEAVRGAGRNAPRQAAGRKVGLYHAGLEPDDRRRVQDDFMSGQHADDRRHQRLRHGDRQGRRAVRRALQHARHPRGLLPGSRPRRPRRPAVAVPAALHASATAASRSSSSRTRIPPPEIVAGGLRLPPRASTTIRSS